MNEESSRRTVSRPQDNGRSTSRGAAIMRVALGLIDWVAAVALVLYRPNDRLAVIAAGLLALLGAVYLLRGIHGLRAVNAAEKH